MRRRNEDAVGWADAIPAPVWRGCRCAMAAAVGGAWILLMGACGAGRSADCLETPYSASFEPLTRFIDDNVAQLRIKGASLILVKDDELIYQNCFGRYDLGTKVAIASSSKWLSASTILSLVDDGLLDLDDKVSAYLPYFDEPGKRDITLRQCLSFTSALPGQNACMDNPATTLDACVREIEQMDLVADPGEAFWYGGASYMIAGRVAEVVTGKRWDDIFQERIAGPLEMTDTAFFPERNPRIPGGAVSTVVDYANFVRMHMDEGLFKGRRVLSAESVRLMQQDQLGSAAISFRPAIMGDSSYGLGVWREVVDAQGQPVEVSDPGAFGFYPWIDHERNLCGVFLVYDDIDRIVDFIRAMQQMTRDIVDDPLR